MKTYRVLKRYYNDDPQDENYFDIFFVASYDTEEAALDAVAKYEEECKRQYRQMQDEDTETINGREYRSMDLVLVKSVRVGDDTTDTYRYEPKTEYDYERMWECFPEQWVETTTISSLPTQAAL